MENKENTIDLRKLLGLLRSHLLGIIFWTIGLGVLGFALAEFVIQPKYTASTQILVNQKNNKGDAGQMFNSQQADIQVITTYKDIITSPVILKDASAWLANPTEVVRKAQPAKYERLADGTRRLVRKARPAEVRRVGTGYNISSKELAEAISVDTQQQSQVFTLNAKTNDPDRSKIVANAVARSFKKKIKTIMNVNNVTIVAPATRGQKTFPNTKLFTLAGLVLGFILSIAVVIIRDSLNTTVREDSFLTDELGLTNLGQVSHFRLNNSFSVNKSSNNKKRRV